MIIRSFQPICGTFILGLLGWMRRILPLTQSNPIVVIYSWPKLAIICIPTQIPKNGLLWISTASNNASNRPVLSISAVLQAGKAPSPGKTIRSAFRSKFGSLVTITSSFGRSVAIRSKAFCAECRFPLP